MQTFIILNHNSHGDGWITFTNAVDSLCTELVHVQLIQVLYGQGKVSDEVCVGRLESRLVLSLFLDDVADDWTATIIARGSPSQRNGGFRSLCVVELLRRSWWT